MLKLRNGIRKSDKLYLLTQTCIKLTNKLVSSLSRAPLVSQPHFGAKCENATHTPKSGKMKSSKTSENSKDDLRGQISLPWCVLYNNGKVLKSRCPKWPCMGHLDICSPSYGQNKGRESNCQFDSRPLKVGNRPLPDVISRSVTRRWKAMTLVQTLFQSEFGARSYERPQSQDSNSGQFRDSNLGVLGKRAIWMYPMGATRSSTGSSDLVSGACFRFFLGAIPMSQGWIELTRALIPRDALPSSLLNPLEGPTM